jgi:hypothetical protein
MLLPAAKKPDKAHKLPRRLTDRMQDRLGPPDDVIRVLEGVGLGVGRALWWLAGHVISDLL